MDVPETRFVAVGDADVAYQVVGEGDVDLLYFYGLGSNIELFWESPTVAAYLTRLAAFSRLMFFDRRGTGASDGISRNAIPTWEEWTEDLAGVLGAVGSSRTAILATLDTGPIAMLFAATHPEMVSALILLTTTCRYMQADDYPIGFSPEEVGAMVDLIAGGWGTDDFSRLCNPSMANDAAYVRFTSRALRASATPRTAAAQYDHIFRNDVRQALPLIQAPTLVLHVRDSPFLPPAHGRYLADHIDGARYVELPSGDVGMTPELYVVADEIAELLTGERPAVEIDRILTTVLFTDIVGSTAQAAAMGDRRWRALLDAHDHAVRDQLRRFRGDEVNTTGDGFVASFDGPARAIRCAQAILEATRAIGVTLRTGLHTGECEVRGKDLGGVAVHIAARVVTLARAGEVLVSSTVKDLVAGSGITFDSRGSHALKGIPDQWALYAVA